MKPKDLPYPFKWEERRPFLAGKIFYVPDYYKEHKQSLFPDFSAFFGNDNPIYVEYCSGNGEWIIAKAQENPEINWVAVELKFERVRKIHSKGHNLGLENLMIISGEALNFSREYLPDASINAVFVNFPDPWPKDRHAKHRLIQAPFTIELKRTLKDKGTVTLVTDDTTYLKQMRTEMEGWTPREEDFSSYGTSYFERLWRSHGLDINYLHYER